MKIKVNRALNAGRYHVNFEIGDFTPDEVNKMSGFGVPLVEVKWTTPAGTSVQQVQITKVSSGYDAAFSSEQEARDYESKVKAEMKAAIEWLRQRKDDYSSSEEEEL